MLTFIVRKVKNQIWLSWCLIWGVSLLVATVCCQFMFQTGSMSKLLHMLFVQQIEVTGTYPTVIGREGFYLEQEARDIDLEEKGLEEVHAYWTDHLGNIPIIACQQSFLIDDYEGYRYYSDNGMYYGILYVPEYANHSEILKGTYEESRLSDGSYPCMVPENVIDSRDIVLGEEIVFKELKDTHGEPLKVKVTGFFREADATDLFWNMAPNSSIKNLYLSKEAFGEILKNYSVEKVQFTDRSLLDYQKINSNNVEDLDKCITLFQTVDSCFQYNFKDILAHYNEQKTSVEMMIWVLGLPILGMVLAFIYMVSGQIALLEQGEIASLKSRGVYRRQVVLLYFFRALLLCMVAFLLGLPLGYGFCKLAAYTTDFLTFNGNQTAQYVFDNYMLLYGAGAALVGLVFILIPVVRYSKVSIVEYKSTRHENKRMIWEKAFLDVILMAVSLYLWQDYQKSVEQLKQQVLSGNRIDPVIYLNTCLFIMAAGLLLFRLVHYLVRIIYAIGRKRWKPVSYAAFLQITRTFRKQMFISLFLILTVSLGLFYANAARTINRNKEDRITYAAGSDVRFKEKWKTMSFFGPRGLQTISMEADFAKYDALKAEGLCESFTKVMVNQAFIAHGRGMDIPSIMCMAIDTKAFGETAYLKEELSGDRHWFHDLNALAAKADGVIISSNLARELNVSVGNGISIAHPGMPDKTMLANVVAIVDAWPGYEPFYMEGTEEMQRYLMVVNMGQLSNDLEMLPYEIWCKLSPGVTAAQVRDYLTGQDIPVTRFTALADQIEEMKASPMIQVTNGLFSLSFMIALALCGVGFLIYWVASIRQRELLFGVYRAMGLSVGQINRMLIYEHLFSTLLFVLGGGLIGVLATKLHTLLFAVVYLPERSNMDIYLYSEPGDMLKLFTIIGMMILVCLIILRGLIRRMNISQALKLGEEG